MLFVWVRERERGGGGGGVEEDKGGEQLRDAIVVKGERP